MYNIRFYFFLCLVVLSGCIEEFKIDGVMSENYKPEIVIQGRIQAGDKSVIYVSYTQILGSTEEVELELNAEVTIVGQNGYESEKAEFNIEEGYYSIDTRYLPLNTLYAVQVVVDGKTYQSEYQTLWTSPEIDEITYKEREDGISIHVSTHNDENASRYYLWSYEEDCEFHAPVNIVGIGGGVLGYNSKFYQFDEANIYNPYYFCWLHQESSHILIYDTSVLEENVAKEVELLRIPIDDVRISYIYSILVKQCCLDADAYTYYRTLKTLTEVDGSIFTPMPVELKGNVSCISHPEETVRGYVFGSSVTSKRIFIYEADFKSIRSEYEGNCVILTPDVNDASWIDRWIQLRDKHGAITLTTNGSFYAFQNQDWRSSKLYQRECVDCRSVEGSTKNRPDFWPNNHE